MLLSPEPVTRGSVVEAYETIVLRPTLITSIHLFLYGFYVLLLRIALNTFKKRPETKERRLHKLLLVAVFVLVSIGVPINLTADALDSAVALWARKNIPFPPSMVDAKFALE
ncbi:hypothetical protein AAF712_003729 [Marasmius tenuissimus]|uniref:Uncharacterized protein n=1 Tax=Marasmius tenuissimus TaxID=585030 RepID=A0ABR3A6T5_9AGAR|nr:hypothetical protein PM082_012430 [Marasmius tenuissimus]